jgi:hypothetical protein
LPARKVIFLFVALEVNHSSREPMVRRTLLTFLIIVALLVRFSPAVSAQQKPLREIAQNTGDLCRFGNAGHLSVFLVTPAGGVLRYLREEKSVEEIKQRVKMEK